MNKKLQELTDRLYQEGVEKARLQADLLIAEAEKNRDEILESARTEAERIIAEGKKNVETMEARKHAEWVIASKQAIATLRQNIVNILSSKILGEGIRTALKSNELVIHLIRTIAKGWVANDIAPDLHVIIPHNKTDIEEFRASLEANLKESLDTGFTLTTSDGLTSGFRMEAQDGRYVMSFTEEDFQAFFRSFFKDNTCDILFGDK